MKKLYPNYGKRAFTLIELMVVVAIIGILATMISINLMGAQAKGRDTKRKADLSTIMSAIVMYGADHGGVLPASDYNIEVTRDHVAVSGSPLTLDPALITGVAGVGGGYIDKMPNDPKCQNSSCTDWTGIFTGYVYLRDEITADGCGGSTVTRTAGSTRKGFVYASLENPSTSDTNTMSDAFDTALMNGSNSLQAYTCSNGTNLNFKLSN